MKNHLPNLLFLYIQQTQYSLVSLPTGANTKRHILGMFSERSSGLALQAG